MPRSPSLLLRHVRVVAIVSNGTTRAEEHVTQFVRFLSSLFAGSFALGIVPPSSGRWSARPRIESLAWRARSHVIEHPLLVLLG